MTESLLGNFTAALFGPLPGESSWLFDIPPKRWDSEAYQAAWDRRHEEWRHRSALAQNGDDIR